MRWDELFDDLESQLEREMSAEEADLDLEEERLRLGRLSIRDRLIALHETQKLSAGYRLGVTLVTGERLAVHPLNFGRDWFSADVLVDSARPAQCILPIAAIQGITLDREAIRRSLDAVPTTDTLSARLGLAFVLRDLCRRRRAITLVIAGGSLAGTIDRVGRDHVDLAEHEAGAVRRNSAVTGYQLVPFASIVMVRL